MKTADEATDQNRGWSTAWWAVAGFIAGKAISTASLWPEFYSRLRFALNGGGGESSDWGEPLFYMAITGVPAGLIGAAIAGVIACTMRRLTKLR